MSFDSIPTKLDLLLNEVQSLKELISKEASEEVKYNEWLTINELVQYIPQKPAKSTIYGKVNRKEIPFYKRGKHLYFKKSEIDNWLLSGKVKGKSEAHKEVVESFALLNSKR